MQDYLEYFHGLNSLNVHLGLGPIWRLLDRLENPHETYRTILIGGTNGKGSIAAMVASILCQDGFNVGLYTSPHLIDIRERIRVNGRMITRKELGLCTGDVKEMVHEDVTYFEFLTAVAFLYFSRLNIDVAVIEVGMGGRLDATNVVKPLVSVISNISIDHQHYLGNSLEAIAREKGGIIKRGGVCVTASKQKRVIYVLKEICLKRRAKLFRLGEDIKIQIKSNGTFNYRGIGNNYRGLICPLKGRHQLENAALAVGTVEAMRTRCFEINDDAIYAGIRNTRWEGRLGILRYEPMVLVDGAHNPAGISALCRALKTEFIYRRLILIFGVLNDKDYKTMMKKVVPMADRLIVTRPKTERAMPTGEVASVLARYSYKNIEIVENSLDALKRALSIADINDLICITGSLYLVGEIKEAFLVYNDGSNNPVNHPSIS
jgi:dihydrofolate synthase / folylpolyglutamate synthase